MIISVEINNCLIYNRTVEFSMIANMHYKKFSSNVANIRNAHILKSAILIGPNNAGKTNFVRVLQALKQLFLNQKHNLYKNLFSSNPVIELRIDFIENQEEFRFEIKYDTSRSEYVFERFCGIQRDSHNYLKIKEYYMRDNRNNTFSAADEGLMSIMQVAAKNNILIYLIDTASFPYLQKAKEAITSFASRIDIVDMNNIPIQKTIDMLKQSEKKHQAIAKFILNADLSLDDFRYSPDDEVKIVLEKPNIEDKKPQENAIALSASLTDMLHLTSVYHGIKVPSLFYDSTGTKKMAALASYVIDALENGRILVVDELDNSLHFRLTRAIIALFNNELNQNAQIIATVHDVSLLDCHRLFRKEQIWFVHKDKENAYLYSLSEFTAERDGVRDTSDLIQKYRNGVFGALPEPDLFPTLTEEV